MRYEEVLKPVFLPLFSFLESLGYFVEYSQGMGFDGNRLDEVHVRIFNTKINRRLSFFVFMNKFNAHLFIYADKTEFDFSNYLASRSIWELDELNRDCRENPSNYTIERFYSSAVEIFLRYLKTDLDKLIRGEEWIDAPYRHKKEMWDLIYGQQKEELFPTVTNESTTNGEDSTSGDGKEKPEKE